MVRRMMYFRAFNGPVSLKHGIGAPIEIRVEEFPGLQRPGLIEARNDPAITY